MTGEAAADGKPSRRHVVVMGVSGCGKTTVAHGISRGTGMVLAEADDFHSEANVAKMRAGQPLDDDDRWPWLEALSQWMRREASAGASTVIACSALRRPYRDVLRRGMETVDFIHLTGPAEAIRARMAAREGHFMPSALLASQLATLEPLEPDESGVVLDLRRPAVELVAEALTWLDHGRRDRVPEELPGCDRPRVGLHGAGGGGLRTAPRAAPRSTGWSSARA